MNPVRYVEDRHWKAWVGQCNGVSPSTRGRLSAMAFVPVADSGNALSRGWSRATEAQARPPRHLSLHEGAADQQCMCRRESPLRRARQPARCYSASIIEALKEQLAR